MPTLPNPNPNTVFGAPPAPPADPTHPFGSYSAPGVPIATSTSAPAPLGGYTPPTGQAVETSQGTSLSNQAGALVRQLKAQGLQPGTPEFKSAYDAGYQGIVSGLNKAAAGPTYTNGAGQQTYESHSPSGEAYASNSAPSMSGMGGKIQYLNSGAAALGGDPNSSVGQSARDANALLQMQGANAQGRTGPQINTGATNLIMTGAGQSLSQANGTDFLGLGNAGNTIGVANGQGYQGQIGAAQRLMEMSQMPTGPSVAQQQLQQGGDAAMQQQMAMAAGARGGNAGLALQNAAQNQGQIQGQLNAQMGVQRAQEDMANRTFAANAAQGAGSMYGQAAGTQLGAYSTAGQQLGQVANNQLGQGQVQGQIGGVYAGMAGQQLGADSAQAARNDAMTLQSQGMGLDVLGQQRAAEMGLDQGNANLNAQAYAINTGQQAAMAMQKQAQDNDWTHQVIGGTIAAAGAVAAPFTGGASLAAVPAGVGIASSDIRAKKDIHPAGGAVSDAFRGAQSAAETINGTNVQYPIGAYSYEYKNPSAPGAAPGTHYGPMAHELEQTPAGASVVGEHNGRKFVDTNRLTMLTASEVAKQRAELDALLAQAGQIKNTNVPYPTTNLWPRASAAGLATQNPYTIGGV